MAAAEAAVRIQSDWDQVLRKNEGEAWLSCRSPGKSTVYGTLTCQGVGTDGTPEITASEGFVVKEVTKKSLLVSCPRENASTQFRAPYTAFCRIHQKSVTCLDLSSGGGLGVSTSADGTMKIWQAANGEIRRRLEGHVYDVNCCRFFPSGLVVLSGGMDAQLKIWSAEDGRCVATFQGHKAGILDTAIVDRGRNVVSSSRDGTARLWDCGRSACLGTVADCGSPVNGIALGGADNTLNLGSPETAPSEREIGTEGKLLLLAREDKKFQGVGLQSRQPVFLFVGSDAFNCCTFLSSIYLLAGAQDGNIYQLDVRNTKAPIRVIQRSGAPVLSLLPYKDGFIASQGDGTCFILQQDLDHIVELTGADCDPVYKVLPIASIQSWLYLLLSYLCVLTLIGPSWQHPPHPLPQGCQTCGRGGWIRPPEGFHQARSGSVRLLLPVLLLLLLLQHHSLLHPTLSLAQQFHVSTWVVDSEL